MSITDTGQGLIDQAKEAIQTSTELMQATCDSLEELLAPFTSLHSGISIAGIQELKGSVQTIRAQLSMLAMASRSLLSEEEKLTIQGANPLPMP